MKSLCYSESSGSFSVLILSPKPSSILWRKLKLNSLISFYSPTLMGSPKSSTRVLSTSLGSVYFFSRRTMRAISWPSLSVKMVQALVLSILLASRGT